MSRFADADFMSLFANALANANAIRLARKSVKSTANARRSLVLAYVHFEAVKDTTVKWQNTVKVYCSAWVTAHVVISMDRMYNGRAATMNTIASGSLMGWVALATLHRRTEA